MSHGPSKQDSDQHSLNGLAAEKFNLRLRAVYVYFNLFEIVGFVSWHVFDAGGKIVHGLFHGGIAEVMPDYTDIFFSFPRQGIFFDLLINRYIVT